MTPYDAKRISLVEIVRYSQRYDKIDTNLLSVSFYYYVILSQHSPNFIGHSTYQPLPIV